MMHMIGAFPELGRALIRERTIAGLPHACARGKRLGRPRLGREGKIRTLKARGRSHREIEHELGLF
jgi:DNA invertase Pin-like site-specific DNA recombinase